MSTELSHLVKALPTKGPWQNKKAFLALPLAMLLLGGCGFGFGTAAPTPEPFNAPAYQPSVTATPIPPAEPATEVETQTAALPASQAPAQAANALPQAATGDNGQWIYTGEIEPKDEMNVVTEVAGHVLEVDVNEGDKVKAGQTLVKVDTTALEAQRAQALAGLQAAQANLELLQTKATDSDIEAAKAGVSAAEAGYQHALNGPTDDDLKMAQAQLMQAKAAVDRAQAAYDKVSWNPMIAALPESLQLQQATLGAEAAQAQYDKLTKGTTQDVIAAAYAQVAAARATLQRLQDGPKDAQVQAAEAQVHQAETGLYLAQLQLDKAVVKAPVDGIVSQVNLTLGSMALAGSPAVHLLSPTVKIVIPVEEGRMAQLKIGQPAHIQVNAYPGQVFDGALTAIAPELDPATRTVRVTVEPANGATQLSPGMFATVELVQQ